MKLRRTLPRLAVLVLLLSAIAAVAAVRSRIDVGGFEQSIAQLGILAPLGYVVAYALATVLFVPGALVGLIGGALFGPVLGVVYTLAGATIGASLAFLLARVVASDWVAGRASGRLKQLKEGVEAEGWRFVLFVRLVPLFPFNLLNYALGLTRIGLADYAVASLVGMVPGTIAYTYMGYAGREALAGRDGLIRNALIALAVLASVAFLPRLVRRLRAARVLPRGDTSPLP